MKTENKTIYSDDKNIVDTFIKVVKDKANFTITKDDSEENIIIPSNIREYVNTITFIYREGTLDSFKKYLMDEINNNLSRENIQFFHDLNNTSNKILNKKIINRLGVNYEYELEEDLPELYSLTLATNQSNVSYGDVLSIIRSLDKTKGFSKNETPYFLTYLFNYYSIRLSESLKSTPLLKKDYSEFNYLINGQLTNEYIKYLPSERNEKPRDYFKINKSPKEIYELILNSQIDTNKEELYLWLSFFFDRLGDDTDYVTSDDEIKKRTVNRPGSPFESVTFNAISFLHNILTPENTIETYIPNFIVNKIEETQLYKKVIDWNDLLNKNDDYFQIFNIALFNKFINSMYNRAKTKDSLIHIDAYLYEYIIEGIPELINELNKDYNYDFGKLLEHPILKYWKGNLNTEPINLVLRKLFETPKEIRKEEKHDIKEIFSILRTYSSRIRYGSDKKRIVTNLIRKLEKRNSPKNFLIPIRNMRSKMNDPSLNLSETTTKILELIENLINNG
tara:strand:- start:4799 stop:6316 length:1518 start_codon:yes stop_codon:yes gene_type:complete